MLWPYYDGFCVDVIKESKISVPKSSNLVPDNYPEFLRDLKERIRSAQVKAALAVNRELVLLYWQIGRAILERQAQGGWGAKVIENLSKDLRKEFPDMKGFSRSNLMYMRAFAEAYSEEEIVQGVLGQITWYHNITLLEKLKSLKERLWYAQKAIENGWSRNVMVHQIESCLFERQGGAITNFSSTLPATQSDLAHQLLKSPYNFEFLGLSEAVQERELENALIRHIRDFLLELGVGFSFLGSQYPLEVSGKDYRIDLLFYHVRLHCYVVIDLKTTEFEAAYSGQMAFYVAAVDDLLRTEVDQPTIGIILCKAKDKTTVQYALQYIKSPIGVATYSLGDRLPESLQNALPSVEQLQAEFETALAEIEDEHAED